MLLFPRLKLKLTIYIGECITSLHFMIEHFSNVSEWDYCAKSDIVGIPKLHIHQFAYRSIRGCRLIWCTTWRTDCMWRFVAYFISPASRVHGDICTMEPLALSAGILAFIEARTRWDAGDETTAVTGVASETVKETAAVWPIRARW